MIDKRKVRLMTRMALYEATEGKEDLKISSYYRKDYTSSHTIATILWVTAGYVCLLFLLGIGVFGSFLEELSTGAMVTMGIVIIVLYLVLVIGYAVYTHVTCRKKHRIARARVKNYNRSLIRLLKAYKNREIKKERR